MITNSTDPVGGNSACLQPGGSNFQYAAEVDTFAAGFSVSFWFRLGAVIGFTGIVDRLFTFEDGLDPLNDIRVSIESSTLKVNGVGIGGFTPRNDYYFFAMSWKPGDANIQHILSSDIDTINSVPYSGPLTDPNILIGKSPDRDFQGDIWDERIYNKYISIDVLRALYYDVVNNQGQDTVPL
jgi:hypothetical protein